MEPGTTSFNTGQHICADPAPGGQDLTAEQRLAILIQRNAAIALEKSLYRSDRERVEAALMVRPISSKRAFAYFGFMLGAMPPASLVLKIVVENGVREPIQFVFIMLLAWAGFFTGLVGYVTGRYIPSAISSFSNLRVPNRIAMLSLIGFVWGAISGAAGGLFLFIIGSVVAAFVGGIVGAVAFPTFAALHNLLRRGDGIEVTHFLPISFGISLLLCAFILGL